MTLTLFRRALRQHLALLLGVCAAALVFELLVVYVMALMDTGAGIQAFLEQMLPPSMRELVFSQLGIASFPGAVAFGFQHPISLVAAVVLMVTAGSVPASEREAGWLDLVLARPVPRGRYILAHGLLVTIAAAAVPLAMLAGAARGLAIVDGPGELPWTRYFPAALALAPLLLLIGMYTLLLASDTRRRGTAVARAAGLSLLFYWLDFMGGFWDALRYARWLSPFHYYDPARATIGSGLGWRDPLLLLALALICFAGALLNFRRQDL